jgi:5-methylcytosine-specific restriction endonuclease McrA
MPRPRREIRDGKLFCPGHGDWAPVSSFTITETGSRGGPRYRSRCKLCEQTDSVDAQRMDPLTRARDIVAGRAGRLARDLRTAGLDIGVHQIRCADPKGCDKCRGQQLNWDLLTPLIAAFLEERCYSCAEGFGGRHDVQLDHIHAWKIITDLPLHHARNLRILCGSCNNAKKSIDDEAWVRGEWDKQQALYQRNHETRFATCPMGCIPPAVCLMCA